MHMLRFFLILLVGVICTASAQQTGCPTGHFQCSSGQCISASGTCNGYPNCQDGSDEEGCVYPACEANKFQCPNSPLCLPQSWVCNGITECPNGEDEEQNCPVITCSSDQFTCASGGCIHASWECDRWNDCRDGSDEVDCDHESCTTGQWQCKYGMRCIDESKRCDAELDCFDGSDEYNCTFASCLPEHMECNSGECLPSVYECNHYAQCWDASDEVNCTHADCGGEQHRCQSGQCIPAEWVCDGIIDCYDRSDEERCVGTFSCPPGLWPCSKNLRKCVDVDKLCDGNNDCPDGEDEEPPCNSRSCGYLSCEYQCHAAPNGGTCKCNPGFVVASDNRTCEDFDECNHWGYCAHGCENEAGTYQCSCEDGYILEGDGYCRSSATDVPFLLVTSGQTIIRSNLNGQQPITIATMADSLTPENLDFHFSLRKIFWTSQKGVHSSNFLGGNPSEPEVLFAVPDRVTVTALAVDWIGSKLYMAESTTERIVVTELDGTRSSALITSDIHTVSALAVDPVNGYMFFGSGSGKWWRDEQYLKLERSFMDGSHRSVLATEKVHSVTGIALDIPTKRIYWIDQSFDFLSTITYDGHYRYTILQGFQAIPSPQSLAVFERFAFIADHTRDAVLRADRYDWSSDETIGLPVTDEEPKGVAVYHSSQQPSVPNPCGTGNGGCDHLCLVSHRSDNHGLGYKCACQTAYRLNDDGRTCSEITSFLLMANYYVAYGISLNSQEVNVECIEPITKVADPDNLFDYYFKSDFAFDAESRYIYYKPRGGSLQRVKTDGTGKEEVYSGHFYPYDMSYDWLSKNLYWADVYHDIIAVLKLDGDFTTETVINRDNSHIHSIEVAPLAGYIFWHSYTERKLVRAWLDGSHVENIVTSGLGVISSLVVDHQGNKLYWSNHLDGQLWQIDFDGGSRTQIDLGGLHVHSMTVNDGFAYIVGGNKRLLSFNISSGYMPRFFRDVEDSWVNIQMFSLDRQSSVENLCSRHGGNSDCSHFCFPAPSNQRTCGCPLNMRLMSDQRTCEDDPNAEDPWLCSKTQFECEDGSCILQILVCDGYNDCSNNEDEQDCRNCSRYAYQCVDGSGCYPWTQKCNRENDCADGSDEADCRGYECGDDSFHCADGTCILQRWRCDTNADCPDGSDEVNCEGYTCPPDHFTCQSVSSCIPQQYVCDGFRQCADLSDEANCASVNCSYGYFPCANGYQCVSPRYVCDSQSDCGDGSDEADCEDHSTTCNSQYYMSCTSTGTCIPTRWRCDGVSDCEDGSDEPSDCGAVTCAGHACDAYTCIAQDWVCDGENDCVDASDENDCPVPEFSCPDEHWQCPDTTQCVPFASVCDQNNDCPNGEDEGSDCNSDECSVYNGQCSHICLQTPFGAACECPVGYQLDSPKQCVDFDECTLPDSCSQECVNVRGSFVCQCAEGFLLEPDLKTCKASDPSNPYLIITSRGQVFSYNLVTSQMNVFAADGYQRVTSADFDALTEYIYYSDAQADAMFKTTINGTDTELVFGNGIQTTSAMAVDWVGRNVYWMDSILDIIEVASLDRSHRSVLISQNISHCHGLCVDPTEGSRYLFWVDRSRNPRIERASLDGTDRQIIISDDIQYPYGLAVDLPTKKLYFGDRRLDFIDSCEYDGTGRRRILLHTTGNSRLMALSIFEDFLYWIDIGNRQVLKAKKFSGENKTVVVSYLYRGVDIHVFHPANQPPAPNPCASNPCTHLCVLSSNDPGFSCLCPAGQDLQADGTCRRVGVFLLVIQRGSINGISLDPDDQSLNRMQAIATEYDAFDLDFDEMGSFIYWTEAQDQDHEDDSALRSILRAEFTGVNRSEVFVPTAYLGSPVAIAVDHLSRNIYWTNPEKHTIEVIKLDGESNYRRNVIENSGDSSVVQEPDAICLDPGNGMMYWAENGGLGVQPSINSANMDGTGFQRVITTNLGHIDFITIDIDQHMLYWSEETNQVIERSNVDGTNRQVIVTDVHHPMGVAVYGNFLYYTDTAYEKIMRVDKNDGGNPTVMRTGMRSLKALRVFARPGPTSNGCSQSNGGCQHLCLPTGPTSRTCACSVGFVINSDGVTCGNLSSFAVVAQLSVTRGFGLDGTDHPEAMVPIAGRRRYTLNVDVHVAEEFIFFVDYNGHRHHGHYGFYYNRDTSGIQRIKPDGSGYQEIVQSGLGRYGVRGIAVDWIAGNLYWTNAHQADTYIEMSRLDGSLRLVLQKIPNDKPRAIAVNPHKKYLYWADYGQTPRIVRAFLDGTNQTDLATVGVVYPSAISIDFQTHDVFWVDSQADVLEKMDWQGSNRRVIRRELPRPYGVAVFRDSVYWVDRNLQKVFQASKFPNSDKDPDVFLSDLENLRAIAIYDARNQLSSNDNACGVNNGGCDQLCLAMPTELHITDGRICRCAVGDLASDGVTCQNATSFLLVSSYTSIIGINFDPRNHNAPISPISPEDGLRCFTVHEATQRVYFIPSHSQKLKSVPVHGGQEIEVIDLTDSLDQSPLAMRIDWLHDRLYILAYSQSTTYIYAMDLDGSHLVQVISAAGIIWDFDMDPCRGKMYWIGGPSSSRGVYQSSMGGRQQEKIADVSGYYLQLSVDPIDQNLYWMDGSYQKKLMQSDLAGNNQDTLLEDIYGARSFTVHGDYVYFTSSDTVSKVEKDTGADLTVLQHYIGYTPRNIQVFNGELPDCTASACSAYNGGCSHICHPGMNGGVDCLCPLDSGLVIANNGRVCVPQTASCQVEEFTCVNGEVCIPQSWACDVDNDCGDNSDEAVNYCYDHTCESTEFLCNNGRCVPSSFICDYDNDCRDNSDEVNCEFPTCPVDDYTCPNARCIPQLYVCDGFDDCQDGNFTDERTCPDVTCELPFVKCPNTNICIHAHWRCDGDNDCVDRGDENPLFCEQSTCPTSSHRCDSGQCVSGFWLCDDEADCLDGSDEGDFCTHPDFTCTTNYFTCDNNRCIPESWICDTDNDCGDGSDEDQRHSCDSHECAEEYFTCRQNRPGRNRCIPMNWLCDGDSDCEHADDEANCTRTTCDEGEFPCLNGLCISASWECDHDNDCGDQSDEGGHCDYPTCTEEEFTCNNGRCVSASRVCDGGNDCRDYSDERNCVTLPVTCPPDHFMCRDGSCITVNLVCDKTDHCNDMSDEEHCDINECDTLEANQCQHVCTDTLTSFVCSCNTGFRLNPDGITCNDINECEETPEVCSQQCENMPGSYICKCAEGYAREPNGKSCKHESGGDPSLIFSNRYYIRELSVDGTQYDLIREGLSSCVALDFDIVENRLYFLDVGTDQILRMFINGTGVEVIVPYQVRSGQGLAVDWVGRKLYWLEGSKDVMEVSELDGSSKKTLNWQDMAYPRAVTVDPRNGYVYWTDWGLSSYIGRMGMDGNNPQRLISNNLIWPNGLTICYAADKLFWIDAHLNYIGFANLDGSNQRELPGQDLAHPFALSVFEDYVYWTDWNTKAIYRADKFSGEGVTLLRETLHRPFDIHVHHPLRQDQTIINPCGDNNGGCSHLCLIAVGGTSFTCACPDNFIFAQDRKSCIANCSTLEYRCADDNECIPIYWKCDNEEDCDDGSDEPDSCPVRHCDPGYLQCDNLNCASGLTLCDGNDDCGDGSDERMCDATHCKAWEFRCDSGSCVLHNLVCDGVNDCADSSDEKQEVCLSRTCSPGFFKCNTGLCIPESWVCDFDNDCGDNSDEPHRECQRATCAVGWEPCSTNYRCIPSWAFCNGVDNCRDNSDEVGCEQRTCSTGEFRCDGTRCIPGRWVCDFTADCDDGTDEDGTCQHRDCSESEFRCATNQCIERSWVCDHDDDCGDLTDELGCLNYECLEGYFKCTSGHCINENYVCDGDRDCLDFSDETSCPTRLPGGLYCFATEFTCKNTLCIRDSWVCDGEDDCGDGSDEDVVACANHVCDTSIYFLCSNNRCIPTWKLCDDIDDCGDGSDENNHDKCQELAGCSDNQFKCTNDECILATWVCDEEEDCSDASDEIGCHSGSCAVANCGRESNCTNVQDGHFCFCKEGYQLSDDRLGCEDINECVDSNPCTQKCYNSKGGYTCDCFRGYVDRGTKGIDCKAEGPPKIIVFTDGPEIRRLEESEYTDIVTEQGSVHDVDFDVTSSALYWVDKSVGAVVRALFPASLDQKVTTQKVVENLNQPLGISVDWASGNVYWIDFGDKISPSGRSRRDAQFDGPRVAVSKVDGRYVKNLITTNLENPTAIAVNPHRGVMYWTDTGDMPKIEMSWMNGEGRQVLVSERISNPTGITIDFANYDTVYFCDNKENRIESMGWNGEQRKVLKSGSYLENPFSLDVFETLLHFTTERMGTSGKIKTVDKLGRGVPTTLVERAYLPGGLVVYHEKRYQKDLEGKCKDNPCSHLCLLMPTVAGNRVTNGYKCACPNDDEFKSGSETNCLSATVIPNPIPGLPQCKCENGGTCIEQGKCQCSAGFEGDTCSSRSAYKGGPAGAAVAAPIVIIILILVVAVIGFIFYRRRSRSLKPNVDSSVSYRGGANIEMPATDGTGVGHKGDIEANTNFENPVYGIQSPTLQAVGNGDQAGALPMKGGLADNQAGPLPEKVGFPDDEELDLRLQKSFSPTESEGDTKTLVTKD